MTSIVSDTVRLWVHLRVAFEREADSRSRRSDEWRALAVQLFEQPPATILSEVARQRLATVLAADLSWIGTSAGLMELGSGLRRLAQRETLAALALSHLTSQVARLFSQADRPLLVLKGIPLALQTSSSFTGRGGGDLDLLVPPDQLTAAVALLEGAGFQRPHGLFPHDLDSIWGRFCCWSGHELSLWRQAQSSGREWIDLHWSLCMQRFPLPQFEALWRSREACEIHGQQVFTLGRSHALLYAAAHAAKDDWNCLRHMMDIDRLARGFSDQQLRSLRSNRLVKLSAGVAHRYTSGPELLVLTDPSNHRVRRAVALSQHTLASPLPHRRRPEPWRLKPWLVMLRRKAGLSPHPLDWLRTLSYYILIPGAFNDPRSGEDRGLLRALAARLQRLRERLSHSDSAPPL